MTDSRAEELFEKLGVNFERELDWIREGQKPDFYCAGCPNFWCEAWLILARSGIIRIWSAGETRYSIEGINLDNIPSMEYVGSWAGTSNIPTNSVCGGAG
jgi:hypothetical protein